MPASATRPPRARPFATPAPTTAQIHSGITSGCSTCHEAGNVWMGMTAYPISPTVKTNGAQYTGFHTRPRAAATTFSVADAAHPLTGDCSQCHSGTNYLLCAGQAGQPHPLRDDRAVHVLPHDAG